MREKLLDRNGYVKVRKIEKGRYKPYTKVYGDRNDEIISKCLSCKKTYCNHGVCHEIRKMLRGK